MLNNISLSEEWFCKELVVGDLAQDWRSNILPTCSLVPQQRDYQNAAKQALETKKEIATLFVGIGKVEPMQSCYRATKRNLGYK